MDQSLDSQASLPVAAPSVRRVEPSRPLLWLRLGWRDLWRTPAGSAGVGLLVAGIGLLLVTLAWRATYLAPALLCGFLLVAPFVAIVVYVQSRQLERGEALDSAAATDAWRANAGSIALFGLVLAIAYFCWERAAAIVFALFYAGGAFDLARLPEQLLAGQHTALLTGFFASGAVLAAAVFAISVVSAPLLIDRPVDAVTAMLTSLRCCQANPAAMLLWAALIALLTGIGFATAMIGLVFIFPWLAHASWHAYRDMVDS
jgi:uncharacterized membrane protein